MMFMFVFQYLALISPSFDFLTFLYYLSFPLLFILISRVIQGMPSFGFVSYVGYAL
jgi:hypothetical protein